MVEFGGVGVPTYRNRVVIFKIEQDLGLKCSAWKVFGSKDFGLVDLQHKTKLDVYGSKNFGSQKYFKKILGLQKFKSEKLLCLKKSLVQNKFGSKKIWFKKNLVPKKSLVENIQVPKNIWVQKILGPKNFEYKKILGPKQFWVKKNLGFQKNFGLKTILDSK